MEPALRGALIAWLRADPQLSGQLNSVTEEAPARTAVPWLALTASASTDWSCKDRDGREVRIALELHSRGDQPGSTAELVRTVEARVAALPPDHDGFKLITVQFLRARSEQRSASTRATLLEYRFRLLAD